MRSDPIYLDTTVFIALLEGRDDGSRRLRRFIRSGVRSSGPPFLTSRLTLAEVLPHPLRRETPELARTYLNWFGRGTTAAGGLIRIADPGITTWVVAAALRSRFARLKLPDAIHLATAIEHRCPKALTGDLRLIGQFEVDRTIVPGQPTGRLTVLATDAKALDTLLSESAP